MRYRCKKQRYFVSIVIDWRNMKSGYYIYNNEKYKFELDDEYITVVNENGVDWKKF